MKRSLLILFLLIVFILTIPFNYTGKSGYNGISGLLYCNESITCLHEVAHKMDHDLGYQSHSKEFSAALLTYVYFSVRHSDDMVIEPYAAAILGQPGILSYSKDYAFGGIELFSSPQEELYANLYTLANGDVLAMPKMLQPFFSQDEKYTKLYKCLMKADVSWCGRAVHIQKR